MTSPPATRPNRSAAPGDGAIRAALARLESLPGVADAVEAARQACAELRRHPTLRRQAAQARAEATIRAAAASAALDGARLPVDALRDLARGAATAGVDPSSRIAAGALRALSEARHLEAALDRAPAQVIARLHVAAAAGWLPPEALGRPRGPGEQPRDGAAFGGGPAPSGAALAARLAGLADLLRAPPTVPALLVAALAHAEVATARPFQAGNGVVARALARAVVVRRGLDPSGVVVWEAGHLQSGPEYGEELTRYAEGSPTGVAAWLLHCARAVVEGAAAGRAVADAVQAGRLVP